MRVDIKRIAIFLLLMMLSACGDECTEYSDFTCSEIQEADYNVYFYYPDNKEVYLGQIKGLNACGDTAWSYAYNKNIQSSREWSYICCMIAKGSSCYEKHR